MDSISSEDAVLETHFEAVLVFLSVPGRQGCEGWSMWIDVIFPQIAIAIGFLLPIGGGGRRTTLADWTWHQVPLQGAVDVVPLLGAILGCHCSVLYGWGVGCRPTLVVPLLGAIAGCHCSVLWWGRVTANFGGVDVVPLQGAHGTLHSNGTQKKHPENLPSASCSRYTVLYIDATKIGFGYGVYAGIQ